MDDKSLRQAVIEELDFEPSIDSAHIGVAAENGIVTLTGHVGSLAEKLAAESAVKRVRGVRAVAQEIEVRYPGTARLSDDEIARRAVAVLEWDAGVPGGRIQVTVQNGQITLSGKVDRHFKKLAAESAVGRLRGAIGVINAITVKAGVRSNDVAKSIENALQRNAEIEASRIRVVVRDDKVILEGEVETWNERQLAEKAAWAVPGVTDVEDRIRIV
jgi:osmotically-inducible protein OsmY